MKMRKLFAGIAAAATMLGGMALGATASANPAAAEGPVTFTFKADSKARLTGRNIRAYQLAQYMGYGSEGEAPNQTTAYAIDTMSAVESDIREALNTALHTLDSANYSTTSTIADDVDPLAWAAQQGLFDQSNTKPYDQGSKNSMDESQQNIVQGLTRMLADTLKNDAAGADVKETWGAVQDENATLVVGENPCSAGSCTATMEVKAPGIWLFVDASANVTGTTDTLATKAIAMISYSGTIDSIKHNVTNVDKVAEANYPVMKNELITVNKEPGTEVSGIGEKKTFTITSEIPNPVGWGGANSFKFTDTPGRGLTVDSTKWELTVTATKADSAAQDKTITLMGEGKDYTVTMPTGESQQQVTSFDGDGKQFFEVDLSNWLNSRGTKDSTFDDAYIGGTFTLTYTATINDEAPRTGVMQNDVVVDRNGDTSTDRAYVYVGWFNLDKKDHDGKGLAGAEFKLYRGTQSDSTTEWKSVTYDTENALKLVKFEGQTIGTFTGTVYAVADNQDTVTTGSEVTITIDVPGEQPSTTTAKGTVTDTIVTEKGDNDALKQVRIFGLNGYYKLVETKAPDGFSSAFLPELEIHATPTGNTTNTPPTLTNTVAFKETKWNELIDTDMTAVKVTVMNIMNITQLPLTGAAGITLFVVVGLLLIGAAVAVGLKSRSVKRSLIA